MKNLIALFLLIFFSHLHAQDSTQVENKTKKIYYTQKINTTSPTIDGKLDDETWNQVEWNGDYIQREPYDGKAPRQQTAFKILYDDKYLYIGVRCFDDEPDKIVKRMSRRDGFEGDWIEFNIDSYHDLRTAFSFTISASGVIGDEFITNNGNNWDSSWNPIWYSDVNIDEEGWTAELKIPLSQLRYGNKEEHVWGIQSTRLDFRAGERSVWQHIPQNSNTWVSDFGELRGLKGIKPQKQIEIQPYVVLQADTYQKEEGNPFRDGFDFSANAGIDGKIGITSDLVLDFTVNPDFGQVEADPAALRLDGFEVFFQERRPFFIENRNLFESRFRGGNLFYSRRIGGSPKGYPSYGSDEYADIPNNTKIWGAAKFSGKTKNGLSIGVLESITAEEKAIIENTDQEQRKEIIEPLTHYFVGRLMQDFSGGNTVVGGMFTATNRKLDNTNLDWLRKSAYTGALDFTHRWKDQEWFFLGHSSFSKVNGSTESILNTQTAIQRNFQRPDANHLSVDSTATTLIGHGGRFLIGRNAGNDKFNFETSINWLSPGLELNDIGFLGNTDNIDHSFWTYYRIGNPNPEKLQRVRFNYYHNINWDFGLTNHFANFGTNAHIGFKNFWGIGTGINLNINNLAKAALRGGPSLFFNPNINHWAYIETDSRKKISFFFNLSHAFATQNTMRVKNYEFRTRYQPINTLELSIAPSYRTFKQAIQYVTNIEMPDETKYINATIQQKTFGTSIRVNYTILPNLSIQYYGEPFISQGNYSEFKKIIDPLAKDVNQRVEVFQNIILNETDGLYHVDENNDNTTDYSFGNPDFMYMQFRSNLVLRWEYIPGSELFFVWSQGTTNSSDPNDKLFAALGENLFSETLNNTFLIKATYRFLK